MFRATPSAQESQRRQEDSMRRKIMGIDLKNPGNMAWSLETIKEIQAMLNEGYFSHQFILDMYYETKDKVDEHHNQKADESFMALSLDERILIGHVNVEFGNIHGKLEELWREINPALR